MRARRAGEPARASGARARASLRALALCVAALLAVPAAAQLAGDLLVPLTVNGTAREPALVRQLDDGDVWVPLADLEAGGLRADQVPAAARRSLDGAPALSLVAAGDLLAWRLDPVALVLAVDLRADAIAAHALSLAAPPPAPAPATRMRSAYLNYALNIGSGVSPSAFLEGVASVGGHSLVANLVHDAQGLRRGPVTLSVNDEPRARLWQLGDTYAAASGWAPALAVGGLLWRSSFDYQPWQVTGPTLDVRGYANTPSTVDVFVNGLRVGQRSLPAGPFTLSDILATGGGNQVSAVVRDAFGRETRFEGDAVYGSPLLLKPGLTVGSLALGRLRQDTVDGRLGYGAPVLAASASHGVARALTAGGALQLAPGAALVGVHASATSPLGEWGAQWAASRRGARFDAPPSFGAESTTLSAPTGISATTVPASGQALALGWRWNGAGMGLAANLARRATGFATVADPAGGATSALRHADAAWGVRQWGTDWTLRVSRERDASGAAARRVAVDVARRLGPQVSLLASVSASRGANAARGAWLLMTWNWDAATAVAAGLARGDGGARATLDATHTPQAARESAWRVASAGAPGAPMSQSAEWRRDTAFGDYALDAARAGAGGVTLQGRAAGALVWADGDTALAPPIRGAFALVRVPGVAGVPVLFEGRRAGETDADGTLVLTGVTAYARQRVAIDGNALPLDREIGETERRIAPPARGGERVLFLAPRYTAVLGRLVDAEARPLGGATLVLPGGTRIPVGMAGDFALDALPEGPVDVEPAAGAPRQARCRVQWPPAAEREESIRRVGDVPCLPR